MSLSIRGIVPTIPKSVPKPDPLPASAGAERFCRLEAEARRVQAELAAVARKRMTLEDRLVDPALADHSKRPDAVFRHQRYQEREAQLTMHFLHLAFAADAVWRHLTPTDRERFELDALMVTDASTPDLYGRFFATRTSPWGVAMPEYWQISMEAWMGVPPSYRDDLRRVEEGTFALADLPERDQATIAAVMDTVDPDVMTRALLARWEIA